MAGVLKLLLYMVENINSHAHFLILQCCGIIPISRISLASSKLHVLYVRHAISIRFTYERTSDIHISIMANIAPPDKLGDKTRVVIDTRA